MSISQRDPSMVAPSVDACANIFTSYFRTCIFQLHTFVLVFLHFPPLHNRTWHNRILDFSVLAFSYAPLFTLFTPFAYAFIFIYAIVPHAKERHAARHHTISKQDY